MRCLNSKEVSEILGVNVSTLKRWTENGNINCHKTAGGHRKFTMQNVRDYYKDNKNAPKDLLHCIQYISFIDIMILFGIEFGFEITGLQNIMDPHNQNWNFGLGLRNLRNLGLATL